MMRQLPESATRSSLQERSDKFIRFYFALFERF